VTAGSYVDFTEIAVYGTPTDSLPSGTLAATAAGLSVHFTASMSARNRTIASYRWDFGDGSTASTSGPETDHAYAQGGTYAATVTAVDSRGGKGSATVPG